MMSCRVYTCHNRGWIFSRTGASSSTILAWLLLLVVFAFRPDSLSAQSNPSLSMSLPPVPEFSSSSEFDMNQRDDITQITISNATVELCTKRHSCSSLGCGSPDAVIYPWGWEDSADFPLCYCDQSCVLYDDCCYDYASACGQSVDFWIPESEMQLKSFSCVRPKNVTNLLMIKNAYLLVSFCPEGKSGTQTTVQCEDPDTADALASLPCYGRKSGVHFRNIYCALCHGEELSDVVTWKVVVYCDEAMEYFTAGELLRESVGNLGRVRNELGCNAVVEVPGGDDARWPPRRCPPEVRRHCASPDERLNDACAAYTALAIVEDNRAEIYRNPHCALCNDVFNHSGLTMDCNNDLSLPAIYPAGTMFMNGYGAHGGGWSVGAGNGYDPVAGLPSISILFDFRSDSNVRIAQWVTERVQCPSSEVYDPFASRCRRLSCSEGYFLKGDRCVPDIKSFGRACGEGEGDDHGVVIGVVVSFAVLCKNGSADDDVTPVPDDVRLCLADFIGLDEETLQMVSAPPPGPADCQDGNRYSLSANAANRTLGSIPDLLEIPLQDSPLCRMFSLHDTWTLELSQHCDNLPTGKCNARWLNESQAFLATQNDTTLVYVNATESWYALDQTIIRTIFRRRELSFEQFAEVQICAEPTLTCPRVTLNSSLFRDDDSNPGAIVYTPEDIVFEKDEYIRTESGEIEVCSFLEKNGTRNETTSATFFDFNPSQKILSLIGNIVSMLAAAFTFLTYCVFKELRQRISLAIMALVACLFSAQFLLLISGSAVGSPSACTTVAVLGHFFWLATVFWTGVLAVDLNRTFASVSKIRLLTFEKRVYLLQCIFAFGSALLIILPCLVIHLCDCTEVPLSYGNENVCWIGNGYVNLVAFGVPVGATVLANGFLFAFTIRGIRSTKSHIKELSQTNKSELRQVREELFVYIKISTLMGFAWIFGFIAALSDVMAFWYIFIILNSCQGLLIFLSFICNKKVWRLWRALICRRKPYGRSSNYTPASKAMLKTKDTKSTHTNSTQL